MLISQFKVILRYRVAANYIWKRHFLIDGFPSVQPENGNQIRTAIDREKGCLLITKQSIYCETSAGLERDNVTISEDSCGTGPKRAGKQTLLEIMSSSVKADIGFFAIGERNRSHSKVKPVREEVITEELYQGVQNYRKEMGSKRCFKVKWINQPSGSGSRIMISENFRKESRNFCQLTEMVKMSLRCMKQCKTKQTKRKDETV